MLAGTKGGYGVRVSRRAVLNIYGRLYEYRDRIRHVLTAHEQGAAHAADATPVPPEGGVVIATSGPGATNLVTGIATAYMDSIPMVAITGNVAVELLGRDSFQEVDITGITMPVTKHNFAVKRWEESSGDHVRRAFQIAQSGRPGPVLIDVPKDITASRCQYERQSPLPLSPLALAGGKPAAKAAEMLRQSKRLFLYAGGGVIASGAAPELLRFAETLQAPVCTSLMGLGGFPEDHPLSLGMIGMHGSYAAGMALDHSDLIVVLGARFSDRVAGDREKFGKQAKILQLDVDLARWIKTYWWTGT